MLHNLHRKHEQTITYSMLGVQLLQQGGVSSLRKMALFIDKCQQTQFLQQQEAAENELVHRWTDIPNTKSLKLCAARYKTTHT